MSQLKAFGVSDQSQSAFFDIRIFKSHACGNRCPTPQALDNTKERKEE